MTTRKFNGLKTINLVTILVRIRTKETTCTRSKRTHIHILIEFSILFEILHHGLTRGVINIDKFRGGRSNTLSPGNQRIGEVENHNSLKE